MMLHYLDEHNIKLQYCQINKQNFNFCSEKQRKHFIVIKVSKDQDRRRRLPINY
jgi:hypothetical protein